MAKSQGHHVLFTRKLHEAQEPTRLLRQNNWLIPPIEHEAHKALHVAVATVPPLDHFMAPRVYRAFYPVPDNYLASMDRLCFAIEEATQHPRVGYVERGIGMLAIHAIELQKPFIREGLVL